MKINNKQKDLLIINKEFSLTVNQINKENRKIVPVDPKKPTKISVVKGLIPWA